MQPRDKGKEEKGISTTSHNLARLQKYAHIGRLKQDDFVSAIESNDVEKIKAYINQQHKHRRNDIVENVNPDTSKEDKTYHNLSVPPLVMAIRHNHLEAFNQILAFHTDAKGLLNQKLSLFIREAAKAGSASMLQFLIAKENENEFPGEEVAYNKANKEGKTPLMLACEQSEDKGTVKLLLDAGAKIDTKALYGETALHFAAKSNNTDAVKQLLEKKADVNAKDDNDQTPLHLAAELREEKDTVKALLDAGARVDQQTRDLLETPLHLAAKSNNANAVTQLIAKGANINVKNKHGQTPLHIAVGLGNADLVDALLTNRPAINAQNAKGETALELAASLQSEQIIGKLLEQKHSEPVIQSAFLIAVTNKNLKTMDALLKAGANPEEAQIQKLMRQFQTSFDARERLRRHHADVKKQRFLRAGDNNPNMDDLEKTREADLREYQKEVDAERATAKMLRDAISAKNTPAVPLAQPASPLQVGSLFSTTTSTASTTVSTAVPVVTVAEQQEVRPVKIVFGNT